jgi:hypothetical protein
MLSAVLETATGVSLVLSPSLLIGLLLGSSLDTAVSVSLARGVGVALISLGIAYWLARNDGQSPSARGLVAAMLLYNSAFAVLLAHARIGSGLGGAVLWPAVLLHVALALWCVRCLRRSPVPQRFSND